MGMFSEIHAEGEAKYLQKVLIAAIESNSNDIFQFCQEHIYPLYECALGESYSILLMESEENIKIQTVFNPKYTIK